MLPLSRYIDTRSDGHVHTRLCNHATGEMEEYVLAAIELGLSEIIFLEHMETGINYFESTWLSDDDFRYYHAEGERLRSQYSDRIRIGIGVELGYNRHQLKKTRARLAHYTFDRIGISCHFLQLPDSKYHINLLSSNEKNIIAARQFGIPQLLSSYFANLLEAVNALPGNVLCHLDAALRHAGNPSLNAQHIEQIEQLFAAMKTKGMALEVNTSGYRIRGEPFPRADILAKALRNGIPLVAGSDAHRPADVGYNFDKLSEHLNAVRSALPGQETRH